MARKNRVPLGREGTGAATVYGPSRALQNLVGLSSQNISQLGRQQDVFRDRLAREGQAFAGDINKSYTSVGSSPLWGDDFRNLGKSIAEFGTNLRSQGVTPTSGVLNDQQRANLGQYQSDVSRSLEYKNRADFLQSQIKSELDKVRKNPSAYRERDIEALVNFDKNNSFQDFIEGNVSVPSLTPKVDFVDEFSKSGFRATITEDVSETLPDGRERIVTKQTIDPDKAYNFIDNAFRPGTASAIEVEGRLRDAGMDATYDSLLGTTDEDEIRSYIDGFLRSPTPDNPLTEVFGRDIPSLDSPEYNSFLDDAVNEQLKAERILDKAKSEAFSGLQARIPESEKVKYDSSRLQAERARRSEARSIESHRSLMNVRSLNAQKLRQKVEGGGDGLTSDAEVLDASYESFNDEDERIDYSMIDAITIKPQSIELTGVKGYSMDLNESNTDKFRGDLINVGVAAFDKDGNLVQGDVNTILDRDDVEYKPAVWVSAKNETRVYPASAVPSNLPGPTKKHFDASYKETQKKAKELNDTRKKEQTKPAKTTLKRGSLDNL